MVENNFKIKVYKIGRVLILPLFLSRDQQLTTNWSFIKYLLTSFNSCFLDKHSLEKRRPDSSGCPYFFTRIDSDS